MRHLFQSVRSRLNKDAWALVLLVLIELLSNSLSEELTIERLSPDEQFLPHQRFYGIWLGLIALCLLAAVILWSLNQRRRVRLVVLLINGMFTVQLLLSALLLVVRLLQSAKVTASTLMVDATIIFVTNMLIFTLWYWYIEQEDTGFFQATHDPAWDLLFPQRQADYPGYADWTPQFFDYVFVAFTTSVAFSPTDTLPLSRTAKALMMTQSAISLIAVVVVAGTAINILAGTA
jgi:hypothetical protein